LTESLDNADGDDNEPACRINFRAECDDEIFPAPNDNDEGTFFRVTSREGNLDLDDRVVLAAGIFEVADPPNGVNPDTDPNTNFYQAYGSYDIEFGSPKQLNLDLGVQGHVGIDDEDLSTACKPLFLRL